MMETIRRRLMVALGICFIGLTAACADSTSRNPKPLADPTPQATYSCKITFNPVDDQSIVEINLDLPEDVSVLTYWVDFGEGTKVRAEPGAEIPNPYITADPGTYKLTLHVIVEKSDGSQDETSCRTAVKITDDKSEVLSS